MAQVQPIHGRRAPEADVRANTRNLLVNGCGIGEGTEVLIVNEPGRVDPDLAALMEAEARALGARVHVMWSDPVAGPEDLPPPLVAAFDAAEVTVFNHMVAGVLRLLPLEGSGLKMLNFLTSWDAMGSAFGKAPYQLWMAVMRELVPRWNAGREWRLTCPLGTDLRGTHEPKPAPVTDTKGQGEGFTLRTFPIGVSPLYSLLNASGRLVVRWLTPSGVHRFEPAGTALPEPVTVTVDDGRLTAFDGAAAAVAQLRDYLELCAGQVDRYPYIVNSWHAGINPTCRGYVRATDDLGDWMYLAHANPRIAHLHAIGRNPPGEMSVPVIDPTVTVDGETWWDAGRFALLDDPEIRAAAAAHGDVDQAFAIERDIGIEAA